MVDLGHRCIVVDPGIALGYLPHGLLPHPLQVATGERVRRRILAALEKAADPDMIRLMTTARRPTGLCSEKAAWPGASSAIEADYKAGQCVFFRSRS